jgi:eukaryotic-like serine/threonine-protein kinase
MLPMVDLHSRAKEVFFEALAISTREERLQWVMHECGCDRQLLDEVHQLLDHADQLGRFLESEATERPEVHSRPASKPGALPVDLPGHHIGPYELLEPIGEGGMGVVWKAQQHHPIRRTVALKLIRPGLDSQHVLGRFAAERHALSMMDHPNIARVLDAGTTGGSRPFFVMELVRGLPITHYCNQHRLTIRHRLELFLPVCRAIEHAHQKGVIHRDIKPSNVLVADYDGKPVPKVIDFGISKALETSLVDPARSTGIGQWLGTLEYMSPEQAGIRYTDIDTRSDVYSLGVLLYELLTGSTPFDGRQLRERSLEDLLHLYFIVDPPRPSRRLAEGWLGTDVAEQRQLHPGRLPGLLRDELDWIAMKAIDKDRNRRYATASDLASDIENHLADEPVTARPPSTVYRIGKFARRLRGLIVTAAVLVGLVLLSAASAIGWAVHAERQRRLNERMNVQLEQANQHLLALSKQQQAAQLEAQERLREALVNSARFTRRQIDLGHRGKAWNAITEAAAVRPGPDLRDEAIACLPLVDFELIKSWRSLNQESGGCAFDSRLERYVRVLHDGALQIALVSDDSEVLQLPSLNRFVHSWWLQLSPDGKWLSTVYGLGEQESLVVWNLQDRVVQLEVPSRGEHLAAHGRQNLFAYRSPDGAICLHDLEENRQLLRIDRPEHGAADYFAIHPTEPVLAAASSIGRYIGFFSTTDGSDLGRIEVTDPARYLRWSPDGAKIAVSTETDISTFHYPNCSKGVTLRGHQARVCFLWFHPTENLLFSDSWDDSFRVWDPDSGELLLRGPGACRGISEDGQYVVLYHASQLSLHRIQSGAECRRLSDSLNRSGNYRQVKFDESGRWLLACHDRGVSLWDTASSRRLAELPLGQVVDIAWLPAFDSFVTSGQAGLLRWPVRWDESSANMTIGPPCRVGLRSMRNYGSIAVLADGQRIAASRVGSGIQLIDVASARVLAEQPQFFGELAVSQHGAIACAQQQTINDSHIRILDESSLAVMHTIGSGSGYRAAVGFSPDASSLVVSDPLYIRLFSTLDWSLRWQAEQERGLGSYHRVAFSPDGGCLAIPERGVRVRLIDVESGAPVAHLESRSDMITDVVFSPKGERLAAIGADLMIHLWDLNSVRTKLVGLGLDWTAPATVEPTVIWRGRSSPVTCSVQFGDPDSYRLGSDLWLAACGTDQAQIANRLAVNPNDASAIVFEAAVAFDSKRYAEAEEHLRMAIEIDPDLPLLYRLRGLLRAADGSLQEALADLQHAAHILPKQPQLHKELGLVHLQLQQIDDSADHFEIAASAYRGLYGLMDNRTVDCYRLFVTAKMLQKEFEVALGILNHLLSGFDDPSQLDPPGRLIWADSQLFRASCLLELGRAGDAETAARAGLRVRKAESPGDWACFWAECLLGLSLMEQEKRADEEISIAESLAGLQTHSQSVPHETRPLLNQIDDRLRAF